MKKMLLAAAFLASVFACSAQERPRERLKTAFKNRDTAALERFFEQWRAATVVEKTALDSVSRDAEQAATVFISQMIEANRVGNWAPEWRIAQDRLPVAKAVFSESEAAMDERVRACIKKYLAPEKAAEFIEKRLKNGRWPPLAVENFSSVYGTPAEPTAIEALGSIPFRPVFAQKTVPENPYWRGELQAFVETRIWKVFRWKIGQRRYESKRAFVGAKLAMGFKWWRYEPDLRISMTAVNAQRDAAAIFWKNGIDSDGLDFVIKKDGAWQWFRNDRTMVECYNVVARRRLPIRTYFVH